MFPLHAIRTSAWTLVTLNLRSTNFVTTKINGLCVNGLQTSISINTVYNSTVITSCKSNKSMTLFGSGFILAYEWANSTSI